jgi:hypothetical protein
MDILICETCKKTDKIGVIIMKATFVLTPAEARRLIAKAVIQMPEFQKAWKDAYVLLAGGTTNAFIAQELGYEVEPGLCTVGNSTDGLLCVTEPSSRKSFPNVFYKGQPVDKKIDEALQDYHADTVIIKGANAFDQDGHVGIITSGFNGGTVLHRLHDQQGPEIHLPCGL